MKNDVPVLQEVVNSTWRRENELKDLKTELAALDRKIQLSLKPVNTGEDETPGETAKNEISENKVLVSSSSSNHKSLSKPVEDRLQQAKPAIGDRIVIASVQKFEEVKSKGIKI
jgi:hypothetical protein